MSELNMLSVVEWLAAMSGITGAALLAFRCRWYSMAWVMFLISNVFWIIYGIQIHSVGLIIQQLCFVVTSGIGLYRWVWIPQNEGIQTQRTDI